MYKDKLQNFSDWANNMVEKFTPSITKGLAIGLTASFIGHVPTKGKLIDEHIEPNQHNATPLTIAANVLATGTGYSGHSGAILNK